MFRKRKKGQPNEINAGSMADIAFLLLVFFLITTTFSIDYAIKLQLPPKEDQKAELADKNVLRVYVNYKNHILLEDEPIVLEKLKPEVKKFINNNGKDPFLSDSPKKAVVSIKTDRGTTQGMYIRILDEVKKAYHELKAEHLNMDVEAYNKLNPAREADKIKIDEAEEIYPLRISIAEPTDISNK